MATRYSLDALLADLKREGSYKPKTEQELQDVAGRRYQSHYDQLRLSAQQANQTVGLALDRQLAQQGVMYDKQRETSAQQYAGLASQAGRQSLARGMQRSSYGAQVQSNIGLAGAKAQQEISDAQQRGADAIGDQRTLGVQQLADQLRQYDSSQASDTLSYIDQLQEREYDRGEQLRQYENSLAAQLYEFSNREQQQALSQQNWLKEFERQASQFDAQLAENIRQYNSSLSLQERQMVMSADQFQQQLAENIRQFNAKNTSTGRTSPGSTTPAPTPQQRPAYNGMTYDQMMASLGAVTLPAPKPDRAKPAPSTTPKTNTTVAARSGSRTFSVY